MDIKREGRADVPNLDSAHWQRQLPTKPDKSRWASSLTVKSYASTLSFCPWKSQFSQIIYGKWIVFQFSKKCKLTNSVRIPLRYVFAKNYVHIDTPHFLPRYPTDTLSFHLEVHFSSRLIINYFDHHIAESSLDHQWSTVLLHPSLFLFDKAGSRPTLHL